MAETFRTMFNVDRPKERGLNLFSEVEGALRQWTRERFEDDIGDKTGIWRNGNGELQISGERIGDAGFFTLNWEYDGWRLEFQLAAKGNPVEAYVRMRGPAEDSAASNNGRRAFPPSVLSVLLDTFECDFDGQLLKTKPTHLTAANAAVFAHEEVFSTARKLPLILVSENRYRSNLLDIEFLQSRLLGLASVVGFDDETAKVLNGELGALGCYGGAVRIFWPGCSTDSAPWEHRFWRPMQVRDLGRDIWIELRDELMSRTLPGFSRRVYSGVVDSIHRTERDNLRLQLERSREDVQSRLQELQHSQEEESTYRQLLAASEQEEDTYKQLLEISESDKSRLEKEKEDLQFRILELESRVEDLEIKLSDLDTSEVGSGSLETKRRYEMVMNRAQGERYRADNLLAENSMLKEEIRKLREGGAATHPFAIDDEAASHSVTSQPYASVLEAAVFADKGLGRVRFLPSAYKSAESEYTKNFDSRISEIYQVFEILDECANARVKESLGKPVQEWLGERRIEYSDESESTKQLPQCRKDRTFPDPLSGKDILMTHHIKLFRNDMRIHLHWEANDEKWLIGYIGEHLSTASDPH